MRKNRKGLIVVQNKLTNNSKPKQIKITTQIKVHPIKFLSSYLSFPKQNLASSPKKKTDNLLNNKTSFYLEK